MTYREHFVAGVRRLAEAPLPTATPDLDTRVLLGWAAGLTHAGLLSRWTEAADDEAAIRFQRALDRRAAGEPVAWITGFKEFAGMDFVVVPGLLVPRPETETLVEAALAVGGSGPAVDVCTGTGCVAVALAALSPTPRRIWAGDVSALAVQTAQTNSQRLLSSDRRVHAVVSDLLASLPGPWDLIVSNPPYLTPEETRERVEDGGWKEPALALDGGGTDGLELIRRLTAQAASALSPGGWLFLEAADAQMDAIGSLLSTAGLRDIRYWRDLAGYRRVVGARRTVTG